MALLRTTKEGRVSYVDGSKCSLKERMLAKTLVAFGSSHPCLGARSTIGVGNFFLSIQSNMEDVESAFSVLNDLEEYYLHSDGLDPTQKSLGIIFTAEPVRDQSHFAERYWKFIQILHDLDCQKFSWDSSVSNDILNDGFELSLCGRAVFTTTLNPQNARIARKFAYPVWVMNQLSQFNALRTRGKFSEWQRRIREIDASMDPSGEPNPVLTDHGSASAADQLAGSPPNELKFAYRSTDIERETANKALCSLAKKQGCPDDIIEAIRGMSKT